jgi:predicted AlkP superfamily phosphohydrolase/phosphomutase
VTTNGRRVLVIGMDGATFDLIQPWAAQGYLPNLAKLLAGGAWGPLASTLQPATAPAWVTFMTGVNQGAHGLYDFVKRRPDSYNVEVTNATHIGAPTVFDMLSQAGRRVISVNVPYTFPPHAVNGIMVGGPFAAAVSPDLVYPRSYFDKLKALVPDYFVLPGYNPQAADPRGDFAEKLLQEVAQRERLSVDLLQSEPWDLFMVVFMATDEVHHTFWSCMEAPISDPLSRYRHVIRNVYERIDQAIGTLQAAAARDGQLDPTVMVVSDHGGGPFRGMINLNHFLAQSGLLHFQIGRANRLGQLRSTAAQRAAVMYRRHAPAGLREVIRNRLGANRFASIKGEFESVLATAAVDWRRTQAYSLGVGGNIFVNLLGREPEGIVEAGASYDQVCADVERGLMELVDPDTGDKLVKKVHWRGDIYSGVFLEQAPDLVIEWVDYAYWGRGGYDRFDAPIFQAQRHFDFSDQPLTGSHRPFGVLIAGGPGVRKRPNVEGARLVDIAPTLLHLLGVDPKLALDGRVLEPMSGGTSGEPGLDSDRPVAGQTPEQFEYTPDEAEIITEHLRSLGYL